MTIMESRRIELHGILEEILGSKNVYYQKPSESRMDYPAIVYSRDDIQNTFANNNVYMQQRAYQVTVIGSDPDSRVIDEVSKLPTARYNRHYTADNLNHDVFILFY